MSVCHGQWRENGSFLEKNVYGIFLNRFPGTSRTGIFINLVKVRTKLVSVLRLYLSLVRVKNYRDMNA